MTAPTVAVIIPTIPGRRSLLSRSLSSVAYQFRRPDCIVVELDLPGDGPAATRNRACSRASDHDFYAFLDDDDMMEPNHLEALLAGIGSSDVCYSRPADGSPVVWDPSPPSLDRLEVLRANNWVPMTTLVRVTSFWQAGGFDRNARHEDWDLWIRMVEAGYTFTSVDRATWTYTQHDGPRHSGLGA